MVEISNDKTSPPRPIQGMPGPIPYPRQSHKIILGASRSFVALTAISVMALLVWASTTEIDRVIRGFGKIVPQSQVQTV
jgi:adhesin transport system membrane fusion protein